MRFSIVCILFLLACKNEVKPLITNAINADRLVDHSALRDSLGADAYGMKTYVMVFLKKGANRTMDPIKTAELQEAHMANINRLAAEGKLIVAGPFMEEGDLRGIYIFDVRTIQEALTLTETDPAIKAGSLIMEPHLWYSSAALMEIPARHKILEK